jgi:hypothetical protein
MNGIAEEMKDILLMREHEDNFKFPRLPKIVDNLYHLCYYPIISIGNIWNGEGNVIIP